MHRLARGGTRFVLAMALIGASIGSGACNRARNASDAATEAASGPPPPIGIIQPRPAPSFELKDSAGKVHRLEDLRGKAVLVHFWASWCPPCIDEIPNWLAFAQQYEGKPIRFVAISLDQKWQDAQRVLPDAKAPANVISLLDEDGKLPDRFGTYQYPETYLLNDRLEIVAKWVGSQNWASPMIRADVDYAMRGAK